MRPHNAQLDWSGGRASKCTSGQLSLEVLELILQSENFSSQLRSANVIPWSSPVPVFGVVEESSVATVGINPSDREFVDELGRELLEHDSRFHTLSSLRLRRWTDATAAHAELIADSCRNYFNRNPYNQWFGPLDKLLQDTGTSFYSNTQPACHLDLTPFATHTKWTSLNAKQRTTLLGLSAQHVARLIEHSPIRLLVLNGATVVREVMRLTETPLQLSPVNDWDLRRGTKGVVKGVSYVGWIEKIGGYRLGRRVSVVGYNHNIQSSFGVTGDVRASIQRWIGRRFLEMR